jgi:drug/metabolite transporter (DMT)-like permease
MTKVLIVLLLALTVEAMGVVFLSKGLKQVGEARAITVREITRVVRRGATNGHVLLGVALEAAFFGALLYLLSQKDVSLIWPLTSLGFVLTALSARLILHEQVSALRWGGVILIVIGAGLVSYSEKLKEANVQPVPPVVSSPNEGG